jgi:hypothetical protein
MPLFCAAGPLSVPMRNETKSSVWISWGTIS